jgi:beta-glucanase (GH16 family)
MKVVFVALCLATPVMGGEWKLIWSDEFNQGDKPDPAKWTYEEGFIRNREEQFYTRENARIEDGNLIIEARKSSDPRSKYTSASVTTEGKASWTKGRIEVKAKLPGGRGTWPAIWMLGNSRRSVGWPACGEIDIMENVGYEPDVIHANIHTKAYNHVRKTGKGSKITIEKPYASFHIYAVEWRGDRMDFFVDDQKYFTYKNENSGADAWPYDQPHYLILNLAIGGTWGGRNGIDDSLLPQRFVIDYVRVYSEDQP